jgi:cell division transport system ATP-binding protein
MILFDTVTKTYAKATRPALSEVSLEVERGEFVFIVGSSGSGKSTLLRLAIREERATVRQRPGRRPGPADPARPARAAAAPRDRHGLPGLPAAAQQDRLPERRLRAAGHRPVAGGHPPDGPRDLRVVGLEGKEKRLPHQLSGGEQQRVAIARAIVNKPTILLADEPTGNLDPATSREIVLLLDRINRTGTTVVMATHDHEIVNDFRKRVIELDAGKLVRDEAGGDYGTTTSAIPVIRVEEPRHPTAGSRGGWEHAADNDANADADGGRADASWFRSRRARHRAAAQPVDGRLGHPRDDDLDVSARARPARPASGRHDEGLLVRPGPGLHLPVRRRLAVCRVRRQGHHIHPARADQGPARADEARRSRTSSTRARPRRSSGSRSSSRTRRWPSKPPSAPSPTPSACR